MCAYIYIYIVIYGNFDSSVYPLVPWSNDTLGRLGCYPVADLGSSRLLPNEPQGLFLASGGLQSSNLKVSHPGNC